MLRQLVRRTTLAPASSRVQTRSLHSPFVVLSRSKPHPGAESKPAAAAQYERTTPFEKGESDINYESADKSGPRVYVVSQPDPSLGAPFGVRLGAYPVSEPFV